MIVNIIGIKKFILGLKRKYKTLQEQKDEAIEITIETEETSLEQPNEIVEPIKEEKEDLSNEIYVEYVIFPQKVINITQRANTEFTHKNLQAWDIADIDENVQQAFAPCTVKVLAKPKSNANTVLFGSCDENGNPKEVLTENGKKRILTFGLTHDNDISDIKIGHIYKSGDKIYDEGKAGYATGNHIHLEIAEGWQYKKITDKYGNYRITNIIPIGDIFYQLKDWNICKKCNGYSFEIVNDRGFYEKV